MKKNLIEIRKINNLIKKLSKLNESLSFDGDIMEDDDSFNDINDESEIVKPDNIENKPEISNTCDDLVDKIRKMALSGMSDLAENTDNPNYEILKKIWQFCDKKIADDKKIVDNKNNINQ